MNTHTVQSGKSGRQQGFSLLEMVMVIVLLGIIGVVGVQMLSNGVRGYTLVKDFSAADEQGRLAFERLARDLRQARSATAGDLSFPAGNQITFTNRAGTVISYTLSGNTLMRNTQPLADGISALNFSYLRSDAQTAAAAVTETYYISADFSVTQGSRTYVLRNTLHPRAF